MTDPQPRQPSHPQTREHAGQLGAGGGGSNDADSGAGAASGIPDAETAERAGEAVQRGDVAEDRKRLFGDDHAPRKENDPG